MCNPLPEVRGRRNKVFFVKGKIEGEKLCEGEEQRLVSREIAEEAIKIVKDKKGKDIILLDLKGISIIADYFIICGGESPVHMRSIAQEIEKKFKEKGIKLLNPQDFWNNVWILLDFGTVVIHIFSKEGREFYQLERLWADASKIVSTH